MFVLGRKPDQRILIGDSVEVVVLKICGGRVQLGLVAPREISIQRGELADKTAARDQTSDRLAVVGKN